MSAIVSLINVEKSFGKNKVVKSMNIEVKEGEFLTLLGPSGCGKTTTLRMIAGFEDATSGIIKVQGVRVEDKEPFERDVNTVFQNYALFPHMTVFDNIAYGLKIKKRPKDEIKKRVNEMLDLVQLKGYENRKPDALSGGQKQRVAIARALANNPKILLSDEGTSALDPKTTKSILELLRNTRDRFGITIVLITHQMEVIKDICDRVAILENGEIIEVNTVEGLFKNPKTRTAYEFISRIKSDITEEIIEPNDFKGTVIRLGYSGENSKMPIVSRMIKEFDIEANILSGDINKLIKTSVGHLILELHGEDEEIQKAIKFLIDNNVKVEVM